MNWAVLQFPGSNSDQDCVHIPRNLLGHTTRLVWHKEDSLAGFDAVIPLDETIAAAKSVAERMPREHRCTALGGLSITPTSLAIEKRLAACGSGCGCSSNVVMIPNATEKQ